MRSSQVWFSAWNQGLRVPPRRQDLRTKSSAKQAGSEEENRRRGRRESTLSEPRSPDHGHAQRQHLRPVTLPSSAACELASARN